VDVFEHTVLRTVRSTGVPSLKEAAELSRLRRRGRYLYTVLCSSTSTVQYSTVQYSTVQHSTVRIESSRVVQAGFAPMVHIGHRKVPRLPYDTINYGDQMPRKRKGKGKRWTFMFDVLFCGSLYSTIYNVLDLGFRHPEVGPRVPPSRRVSRISTNKTLFVFL
jgi:hypothetical protein